VARLGIACVLVALAACRRDPPAGGIYGLRASVESLGPLPDGLPGVEVTLRIPGEGGTFRHVTSSDWDGGRRELVVRIRSQRGKAEGGRCTLYRSIKRFKASPEIADARGSCRLKVFYSYGELGAGADPRDREIADSTFDPWWGRSHSK